MGGYTNSRILYRENQRNFPIIFLYLGGLLLLVSPRDSHEILPTIGGGTQTPEFYIGKTKGIFNNKSGTLITGWLITPGSGYSLIWPYTGPYALKPSCL